MKPKIIIALIALLLGIAQNPAQDPGSLEQLRGSLGFQAEVLRQPIVEFQERYIQQLETLNEKAQKGGDLDLVLAVKREIELVPNGGSKIPEGMTELIKLRTLYDNHVAKLEAQRKTKYIDLQRGHRAKLAELQAKLTREGQIEEAVKVKREIATIDAAIQEGRGPDDPLQGTKGNTEPGSLVAFGTYSDGSPVALSQDQQDTEFIRVAAGYDHWMALEAEGKVSTRLGGDQRFNVDRRYNDIIDIQCGRHMMMVMREDGSVIPIGSEDHTRTVPEVEPGTVERISLGHSQNLFHMKDGTIKAFGWVYDNANRPFPRTDLMTDVIDATNSASRLTIRKSDGSLEMVNELGVAAGNRPEGLKPKDIIVMEGGLSTGVVILDKKGKVFGWGAANPPSGMGTAVQIRVGAGLCAAQMEDGSWRIWGTQAEALDQKVVELGPLKDLAVGKRYFIAIQ